MSAPGIASVGKEPEAALPPADRPSVDHLVTEDDTPVDNIYSEKQQRLLTEPLYSSWPGPGDNRPFLAAANVGLFYTVKQPPLVPDAFLSLDVRAPDDLWPKRNRSYFFWEYGKPPEAALEVVSNREGEEDTRKLRLYAHMGILYYVIWDPDNLLGQGRLRVLVLREKSYEPMQQPWFPIIGLGLTIWHGSFEGVEVDWLRWCDRDGRVLPTGAERAEQERERADRLAAQLRQHGIEPENGTAAPSA